MPLNKFPAFAFGRPRLLWTTSPFLNAGSAISEYGSAKRYRRLPPETARRL
jgi:hypothetical protein